MGRAGVVVTGVVVVVAGLVEGVRVLCSGGRGVEAEAPGVVGEK